jgi:hypothetical protein
MAVARARGESCEQFLVAPRARVSLSRATRRRMQFSRFTLGGGPDHLARQSVAHARGLRRATQMAAATFIEAGVYALQC